MVNARVRIGGGGPFSCCAKTGRSACTSCCCHCRSSQWGGVPPEAPNEAANEVEESPNEEP